MTATDRTESAGENDREADPPPDMLCFPEGEPDDPLFVGLAEHPHSHCRIRCALWLRRGERAYAYEIVEWEEPESLVDAVLACAGFAGRLSPPGMVWRVVDAAETLPAMSFEVRPPMTAASMESLLLRLMQGELGRSTFRPVVHAASFFHFPFGVFERAWALAGAPPITITRTRHVRGEGSLLRMAALSLPIHAAESVRFD